MALGAWALTLGTGLQVAAWSFTDRRANRARGRVTNRGIVSWLFDREVWRNDQPHETNKVLTDRAFRRQRTGWMFLFLGAFVTAIATTSALL